MTCTSQGALKKADPRDKDRAPKVDVHGFSPIPLLLSLLLEVTAFLAQQTPEQRRTFHFDTRPSEPNQKISMANSRASSRKWDTFLIFSSKKETSQKSVICTKRGGCLGGSIRANHLRVPELNPLFLRIAFRGLLIANRRFEAIRANLRRCPSTVSCTVPSGENHDFRWIPS